MYIHRAVIDTMIVGLTGNAMKKLEAFEKAGILEICQTSVLPIEQTSPPHKKISEKYEILGGTNWIEHTTLSVETGRRSNFKKIYNSVFGKFWKRGGSRGEIIHQNSFRDAVHLDICWINQVDLGLQIPLYFL